MRRRRTAAALCACGALAAVWLALLIAPYAGGGLPGIVNGLGEAARRPFRIRLCQNSLRSALAFLAVYAAVLCAGLSGRRNLRNREEHGSAAWGDPARLNARYSDPGGEEKIMTEHVSVSLDGRRHGRNVNVLTVGGSGSGKTRSYALPNVMNATCSMIILDPKGEILRQTGRLLLKEKGFAVRVFDLVNMERSHCYNPFAYIRNDGDMQRLATNIIKNTTPRDGKAADPFWDQAASMLLMALMSYLHYEAPPEEQNFSMVLDMIRAGDVKEDNDSYASPLDVLFEKLEARDPEHIALKYYRSYHSGSAKTLKSIQITLMSRLEKFNLESLAAITCCDEMELGEVGERKTAVFAVIPDSDTSFNFLVGMLYTQLFQQLYRKADASPGGRLPVHVHFIMDEFANVSYLF